LVNVSEAWFPDEDVTHELSVNAICCKVAYSETTELCMTENSSVNTMIRPHTELSTITQQSSVCKNVTVNAQRFPHYPKRLTT